MLRRKGWWDGSPRSVKTTGLGWDAEQLNRPDFTRCNEDTHLDPEIHKDTMNELSLFTGAGGGLWASKQLGWHTVCACEIDAGARDILLARQRDGSFDRFPIWDDVRTFPGHEWAGRVDIITGGFPCQDISVAGKGDGLDGERSSLWFEMARIIGGVRPRYVYVENSSALIIRGLDRVLGSLSDMGFDAKWGVVSAADAGAWHRRKRIWILAHANGGRRRQRDTQER